MVKAAYSSGKPAFGVGPGNVPVLVDTSADLEDAIPQVVTGKSFDYGTVCSSEQAIVVESATARPHSGRLKAQKAFIADERAEGSAGQAADHAELDGESRCVGQAPTKIARMAGFEVPAETSIICAEIVRRG